MKPEQIIELRRRLSLTQERFGRLLGLKHRSAIAHLEDGRRKPTPPVLRLLRLLEADPERAKKKLEKISDGC